MKDYDSFIMSSRSSACQLSPVTGEFSKILLAHMLASTQIVFLTDIVKLHVGL